MTEGGVYLLTWAGVTVPGFSGCYRGVDERGWWMFTRNGTTDVDGRDPDCVMHVNPAHVANWREVVAE